MGAVRTRTFHVFGLFVTVHFPLKRFYRLFVTIRWWKRDYSSLHVFRAHSVEQSWRSGKTVRTVRFWSSKDGSSLYAHLFGLFVTVHSSQFESDCSSLYAGRKRDGSSLYAEPTVTVRHCMLDQQWLFVTVLWTQGGCSSLYSGPRASALHCTLD